MKGKNQNDNERALLEHAQAGDPHAIEQLVSNYMPLIKKCAGDFWRSDCDKQDIVQEGVLAFLCVIQEFDLSREIRTLPIYAKTRIKFRMADYIREQCTLIRIPWRVHSALSLIDQTVNEWRMLVGREPTIPEISANTGLTQQQISKYQSYRCSVESIDEPVADSDGVQSLRDVIEAAQSFNPEHQLEQQERQAFLDSLLAALNDRERIVVEARFAIGCESKMTLAEVGKLFGVRKQRTKQIEHGAVEKLRNLVRRASHAEDSLQV